MKIRFIVNTLFLLWIGPALTLAQVSFNASIDKTTGSLEDIFLLTLTAQGVTQGSTPQLPHIPGFRVQSRGQSSQQQWVNGKVSAQVDFKYTLIPQEIGTWSIPAISISIQGKRYETRPFKIRVTPIKQVPEAQKRYFAQGQLSHQKAYPNQQLVYTFEAYIRQGVDTANLQFEKPEFPGFQAYQMGDPENTQKVFEGQSFSGIRIRFVLYPTDVGVQETGAAVLHGVQLIQSRQRSRDFFGFSMRNREQKPFRLRAESQRVQVMPLPLQGRPADFQGLVGSYAMEASLSNPNPKVGDSITLTIRVTGVGQAEQIVLPPLSWNSSLKVYEDQPQYQNAQQGNTILAEATFALALVPSKAGSYELPKIRLPFFNPETSSYEVAEATLPELQVTPGTASGLDLGQNVLTSQKQKVSGLGKDLLPIHQDLAYLQNNMPSSTSPWVYMVLLGVGPLGFLSIVGWQWRSLYLLENSDKLRQSKAYASFQKRLKSIQSDQPDLPSVVMRSIQQYVGDCALRNGEALTSLEIRWWLEGQDVPEGQIHTLQALLEECEAHQYAAALGQNASPDLLEKTEKTIASIETFLARSLRDSKLE